MLRPIDMTLTIKGSAEAHRAGVLGSDASRPEVLQRAFAERMEKQVRLQEQQTEKAVEPEKADVNKDRDGSGTGYQPRRRAPQKKSSDKDKPRSSTQIKESLYDIKV